MNTVPPPPVPDDDVWPPDPDPAGVLTAPKVKFVLLTFAGKMSLTAAYEASGFPPTATRESTRTMAWKLTKEPAVIEYRRKVCEQAMLAAQVTADAIVAGVKAIAEADRATLYDRAGRLLPPHEWPAEVRAAVEAVESEDLYEPVPGDPGQRRLRGYTRKVKIGSRLAAYRLLAELKGLVGSKEKDAGADAPRPLLVEAGPEHVPPPAAEPGGPDGD